MARKLKQTKAARASRRARKKGKKKKGGAFFGAMILGPNNPLGWLLPL